MRRLLIYVWPILFVSCFSTEVSDTRLSDSVVNVSSPQVMNEELLKDSILQFAVHKSHYYRDTLCLELINTGGFAVRRIHIEMVKEDIKGWDNYADDISNTVERLSNVIIDTNLDSLYLGALFSGVVCFSKQQNNQRVTFRSKFNSTISGLTEEEWVYMCTNPKKERVYQ